ncbi:hypothetical protein LIN78_13845 [Leeia sp. TBRC 13508]|uniref:Solute-binding protein family 3/N-terminal domain-containing protein n=1 Tax=Leeia speluncae TaxID=2884804 RepID=A0ABS8D8U1_9NEIS|nr:hypothetical protein [Leeia speluncae]MCB6184625.1 hypothetical protein [Leeia speluncae]
MDKRYDYFWSLLSAALESNRMIYGDYSLQASAEPMTNSRALAEFKSNASVNIIARTTSQSLEADSIPIRIPLEKGLTGYRVFLINQSMQVRFNRVKTLADLQSIRIGQDASWPDVKILEASGLSVVTGSDYNSLFSMLAADRFDAFSRGVNEVTDELIQQGGHYPNMTIEKRILLYYPLPRYFFVPKTSAGVQMAARIEDGLKRLIRTGEFEKRYRIYKRDMLAGLNVKKRLLIKLPNPLLPKETPLDKKEYWDITIP